MAQPAQALARHGQAGRIAISVGVPQIIWRVWFFGHCEACGRLAKSTPGPPGTAQPAHLRRLSCLTLECRCRVLVPSHFGFRDGWRSSALAVLGTMPAGLAAEFPFDSELMLDAKPMKGSKRVPILGIGPKGETAIDLWCNSIDAHVVVVESTITILTGQEDRTAVRPCAPAWRRRVACGTAAGHQLAARGRPHHAARRQDAAFPPADQLTAAIHRQEPARAGSDQSGFAPRSSLRG